MLIRVQNCCLILITLIANPGFPKLSLNPLTWSLRCRLETSFEQIMKHFDPSSNQRIQFHNAWNFKWRLLSFYISVMSINDANYLLVQSIRAYTQFVLSLHPHNLQILNDITFNRYIGTTGSYDTSIGSISRLFLSK